MKTQYQTVSTEVCTQLNNVIQQSIFAHEVFYINDKPFLVAMCENTNGLFRAAFVASVNLSVEFCGLTGIVPCIFVVVDDLKRVDSYYLRNYLRFLVGHELGHLSRMYTTFATDHECVLVDDIREEVEADVFSIKTNKMKSMQYFEFMNYVGDLERESFGDTYTASHEYAHNFRVGSTVLKMAKDKFMWWNNKKHNSAIMENSNTINNIVDMYLEYIAVKDQNKEVG